jgi:hypothetical protein
MHGIVSVMSLPCSQWVSPEMIGYDSELIQTVT